VNASAPALTREVEVQSKVRKVRTFGRFARVVCSVIFGFGVVGCGAFVLFGIFSATWPSPVLRNQGFTAAQALAALPIGFVVMGFWLAVVYQLYRLFGSLAAGEIYTSENVRRVRNIGLLYLVLAVLSIAIPFAWAVLVRTGLIEPSSPPKLEAWLSWPDTLNTLVTAGLILLASWIMDVGLYEKDHAEALKRDADLVI